MGPMRRTVRLNRPNVDLVNLRVGAGTSASLVPPSVTQFTTAMTTLTKLRIVVSSNDKFASGSHWILADWIEFQEVPRKVSIWKPTRPIRV